MAKLLVLFKLPYLLDWIFVILRILLCCLCCTGLILLLDFLRGLILLTRFLNNPGQVLALEVEFLNYLLLQTHEHLINALKLTQEEEVTDS